MFYTTLVLGTILPIIMLLVMKKYLPRFKMPLAGLVALGGVHAFFGGVTAAAIFGSYPLIVIGASFLAVFLGMFLDSDLWWIESETD